MPEAPRFAKVGILGTGRVASALGRLLAPHSQAPLVVWGRTPKHRKTLAADLSRAKATGDMDDLCECDLVMIAVADDAMGSVIEQLAAAGSPASSTLIFHVSGRSGVAVLDALAGRGALTAAVHPVMTFTGSPELDVPNVAGSHFAVTTTQPEAHEKALSLVGLLGGVAVEVSEADRPLYHAALCHAANHLVTLIAQASQMLEAAKVPDPEATMAPLVQAALANSLQHGFSALSGPLLRGDRETIASHLDALETKAPDLLPAYRAMALATLQKLEIEGKSVASDLRKLVD